jgi:D-arabinose 1-dehydrogenase-like Zn-dependent alcohol dehydrogenase
MKTERMRVVQVPHPNGPFQLVERPIPEPGAGAVRIKVQACGICHSDSVTKEGSVPGLQYPRVPGHEVRASPAGSPGSGPGSAGMGDTAAIAILAVAATLLPVKMAR